MRVVAARALDIGLGVAARDAGARVEDHVGLLARATDTDRGVDPPDLGAVDRGGAGLLEVRVGRRAGAVPARVTDADRVIVDDVVRADGKAPREGVVAVPMLAPPALYPLVPGALITVSGAWEPSWQLRQASETDPTGRLSLSMVVLEYEVSGTPPAGLFQGGAAIPVFAPCGV